MTLFRTIKEASEIYMITEIGIWKLIRHGSVSTVVDNKQILVNIGELQHFFHENNYVLEILQDQPNDGEDS